MNQWSTIFQWGRRNTIVLIREGRNSSMEEIQLNGGNREQYDLMKEIQFNKGNAI